MVSAPAQPIGVRQIRHHVCSQCHETRQLGTIPYRGLLWTGLTERPQFPPELDEQLDTLATRVKELEGRIAGRLGLKRNRAPVLRLVPASGQNNPQQSA
jgi:hypothetical protein